MVGQEQIEAISKVVKTRCWLLRNAAQKVNGHSGQMIGKKDKFQELVDPIGGKADRLQEKIDDLKDARSYLEKEIKMSIDMVGEIHDLLKKSLDRVPNMEKCRVRLGLWIFDLRSDIWEIKRRLARKDRKLSKIS